MGEVYCAGQTKLGPQIGNQFLHEDFSKDADKWAAFIREAGIFGPESPIFDRIESVR